MERGSGSTGKEQGQGTSMSRKDECGYPEATRLPGPAYSRHPSPAQYSSMAPLHCLPRGFSKAWGLMTSAVGLANLPDAKHWRALPQVRVTRGGAYRDWECLM